MSVLRMWRKRLAGLFNKDSREAELARELQSHLQFHVEDNLRAGMDPERARREALIKLGGVEQTKELYREQRGAPFLESLWSDLRFSLRMLGKNPTFTLIAVLTIALGIGANATIFSIVSRFVLGAAPVGQPSTLLSMHTSQQGDCCNNFSWPLYTDLRDQAKSFSGVTAFYELLPASIGGSGEPERVWGQATTINFFDVTQLRMAVGRGFAPDEEHLPVVVISHRLWKGRFNSDPSIAGKSVLLSGKPYTIVGVAPPYFRGLDLILDCQFWVPLSNLAQLLPNTGSFTNRDYHWLGVAGRLSPGVTPSQASAELELLAQRFAQAHPETEKGVGFQFEVAGSLPPRARNDVLLFLGALSVVVLLVLCIAFANVTNLLLAQASARQREMAVRIALGATRGQLLRQMLTESLLLALGGGIIGVAISLWATQGLSTFRPAAPVPLDFTVSVDSKVLLYTFILSVITGLLLGVAPAWTAARPAILNALKGADVLASPGRYWSLRNVLVVAQIAISLVLLCATGLFLRSMQTAASLDIGFRSRGILMMSVDPRLNGYTPEHTTQFLDELRQRVSAIPGVVSAAATDSVPLSGGNRSDGFEVVGRPPVPEGPDGFVSVELYMASPGYFDTIGTPLVQGRDFANEGATSPKVAVVSEAFVQRYFKNENPIGQHVAGGGVTFEIIGVTGNIKSRTLGENLRPVLYRSLAQTVAGDPAMAGYTLLVRYDRAAAPVAAAVRGEIRKLDPTLAIFNVTTMEEHLREALFLPRLAGILFGVFGLTGLLLASIGLYGVMSYSVSRRTREIGIRVALGARTGEVQRLIIRQGMVLTAIAVFLGFPAALAAAKFSAAFLYGVQPHDLVTFFGVPMFLAGVALVACWIPARRATRVDPMEALRYE